MLFPIDRAPFEGSCSNVGWLNEFSVSIYLYLTLYLTLSLSLARFPALTVAAGPQLSSVEMRSGEQAGLYDGACFRSIQYISVPNNAIFDPVLRPRDPVEITCWRRGGLRTTLTFYPLARYIHQTLAISLRRKYKRFHHPLERARLFLEKTRVRTAGSSCTGNSALATSG
jgi:hypothetical protein